MGDFTDPDPVPDRDPRSVLEEAIDNETSVERASNEYGGRPRSGPLPMNFS